MKPMLARTLGPKFNSFPCYLQPKLNGIRAVFQNGEFQSRDELLWKPGVLQHLQDRLAPQLERLGGAMLDGELYVHGWRLQDIQSNATPILTAPTPLTSKVQYHVYDSCNLVEHFPERYIRTLACLNQCDLIRYVPTHVVTSWAQVKELFRHYVALGFEGVMLRVPGPYELGRSPRGTEVRSFTLLKYKSWEDDEFICVGVTDGEGKASIGIGALVLATESGHRFNVGTGFTDKEREYFAVHQPIGKRVKVRYLELSRDRVPVIPSFLAVLD